MSSVVEDLESLVEFAIRELSRDYIPAMDRRAAVDHLSRHLFAIRERNLTQRAPDLPKADAQDNDDEVFPPWESHEYYR